MDDKDLPAKFISDQDQRQAEHEALAHNIATYYKVLIEDNIPEDLARKMIIDANRYLWALLTRSSYYPRDGE